VNLSAVIITKNEEKYIQTCIESLLPIVGEIIIVDSYSTDRTQDICLQYTQVKFYQREFDNYIIQKNYANDLASGDYILSLDADEYISPEAYSFFINREYLNFDLVQFHRLNKFKDQIVRYGIWKNDFKIRLWKKGIGIWAGSTPHEHVDYLENAHVYQYREESILHNAYQSITQMKSKSENYARLAAKRYSTIPLINLIFSLAFNPLFKFVKGYVFLQGFRDGTIGFQIAKISVIETFQKYYFAIQLKYKY
jgi:glycosyltransferase involved in cell wall biosynthesis